MTASPRRMVAFVAAGACVGCGSEPTSTTRSNGLAIAQQASASQALGPAYGLFGPGRSVGGAAIAEHAVDPMPGLWVEHRATANHVVGASKVGPYAVGALQMSALVRSSTGTPVRTASLDQLPPFVFVHATIMSGADITSPLHAGFPWTLLARHEALTTRGDVWIDPRREWVDARFEIELVHRSNAVFFETALGAGLDVVEARWRGQAVDFRTLDSWLVVEPAWAGRGWLELHLRGRPHRETDRIERDRARVHSLVPVIPGRATTFDVTIHVPDEHRLDAALPVEDTASAPGWRGHRVRGTDTHLVAAVNRAVADAAQVAEHGGVRWQIAPDVASGGLPAIVDVLGALGPPPRADARLVPVPGDDQDASRGDRRDFIPVPRDGLAEAVAAWWLAPAGTSQEICAWQDALAKLAATWSLAPTAASQVRRSWAEVAGAATPFRLDSNGPQLEAVRREVCARGAMVIAELERRIGRNELAVIVRGLRTQPTAGIGWSSLADEVEQRTADAATVSWLRSWIARPRSPAFGLCDVTVDGSAIRATLVPLLGNPRRYRDEAWEPKPSNGYFVEPYAGRISVAAMRGDDEIARVEVDVGSERVTVDIPGAAQATAVVIDPDATLPMRLGTIPSAATISRDGAPPAPACPTLD